MADFFSPLRTRIGASPTDDGKPCWLGVRVALPALYISPVHQSDSAAVDAWQIELIVNGRWESVTVLGMTLQKVLGDWRADPEEALRQWFDCQPPVTSHQSPAPAQQADSPAETKATAEELDL